MCLASLKPPDFNRDSICVWDFSTMWYCRQISCQQTCSFSKYTRIFPTPSLIVILCLPHKPYNNPQLYPGSCPIFFKLVPSKQPPLLLPALRQLNLWGYSLFIESQILLLIKAGIPNKEPDVSFWIDKRGSSHIPIRTVHRASSCTK